MLLKSLRTSLTINVAFLLLLSMLLINIVMLTVVQDILVNAEKIKGQNTLRLLEEAARIRLSAASSAEAPSSWTDTLRPAIRSAGIFCFVITGANGRPFAGGEECRQRAKLVRLAETAAANGAMRIITRSSIRDIFWQQASYVLIAAPFLKNEKPGIGAALMVPLDAINLILRRTQHIFLIYIDYYVIYNILI